LTTPSHDSTQQILADAGVTVIDSPLPTRPYNRIVEHLWGAQDHEYAYMASLRNELRLAVQLIDPDWWFSLDSDILLPEDHSLEDLIIAAEDHHFDAIAPLVDMVPSGDPMYNFMRLSPSGGTRYPLPSPMWPFYADIIMAAMLLNRDAQRIPWQSHQQGEDIGWSINANAAQMSVGVAPNVRCDHRMRIRG
jgi:hypothetical protein